MPYKFTCPHCGGKEAQELDDALTSEVVRLQESTYLIGMADGMILAEFKNEHGKRS